MNPFAVPIADLAPSQLFVSAEKLARLPPGARTEPVPIRRMGGRLVLTDGHTRAVAAHRTGARVIACVWDTDDLDREAYEICVRWCREEGVLTIADLSRRVVPAADYERLWLDRCRAMHEWVARRRADRADPPEDPVAILAAVESDIPGMVALQRLVEAEDSIHGYRADAEEDWTRRDLSFTWVAERGGCLAGLIHGAPRDEPAAVFPAGSRVLEVVELLVASAARDCGVGRALVRRAREEAGAAGFTHLRVYSAAKRFDDVLRFYRSCGFRPWYLELTREVP